MWCSLDEIVNRSLLENYNKKKVGLFENVKYQKREREKKKKRERERERERENKQ